MALRATRCGTSGTICARRWPRAGSTSRSNLFSSLGYGTDEDDLSILRTIGSAVRPGGRVFVDTAHRDAVAAFYSAMRHARPAHRFADGTLLVEEPVFDPVRGRVETTWYFAGPSGQGSKRASLRVYTATELCALVQKAGLEVVATYDGCTRDPFKPGASRLGILARRPG